MLAGPSGWPRPSPAEIGLIEFAPKAGAKPPLSVSPLAAAEISIRRKSELRVI